MFKSEQALLEGFVDAVQALDPDIVLGFEVQKGSLGYLADRAASMEIGLLKLVSRTPEVPLLPADQTLTHQGAKVVPGDLVLQQAGIFSLFMCV